MSKSPTPGGPWAKLENSRRAAHKPIALNSAELKQRANNEYRRLPNSSRTIASVVGLSSSPHFRCSIIYRSCHGLHLQDLTDGPLLMKPEALAQSPLENLPRATLGQLVWRKLDATRNFVAR